MTKLIKILTILALLIFVTGCEEKPIGEKVIIKSTKDMDPRLKAYPEAVEWYKDSDSYPEAAFSLGYFYQNTLKDYKEAIRWYEIASNAKVDKAPTNIAYVYKKIFKDYNNSIKWYKIGIERVDFQFKE